MLRFLRCFCLLGFLVVLSSCSLFSHRVQRPVQAIWAEDDLLVAISEYQTPTPLQPYFSDSSASEWSFHLEIWPGGDQTKAQAIGEIAEEQFTAGGSIQYSRLYWFPPEQRLLVADPYLPYLLKLTGAFPSPITLEPQTDFLSLIDFNDQVDLNEFAPTDAVLSPDGQTAAVLWHFVYFESDDIGADLYSNDIISFYTTTGAFLYAHRIHTAPSWGSSASQVGPLPIDTVVTARHAYPIESEAAIHNRLIWAKDSSRVYIVEPREQGSLAVALDFNPTTKPLPFIPNQVPNRPLPSSSGPLRSDGLAAVIQSQGNTFTLHLEQITPWEGFESQTLVPLESIGAAW